MVYQLHPVVVQLMLENANLVEGTRNRLVRADYTNEIITLLHPHTDTAGEVANLLGNTTTTKNKDAMNRRGISASVELLSALAVRASYYFEQLDRVVADHESQVEKLTRQIDALREENKLLRDTGAYAVKFTVMVEDHKLAFVVPALNAAMPETFGGKVVEVDGGGEGGSYEYIVYLKNRDDLVAAQVFATQLGCIVVSNKEDQQ